MKKLFLILSFDHELSLGRPGCSYADSLFYPTSRLFEIANKYQVPLTLFSDVLCGIKMKEWNVADFYKPYEAQLQEAVRRGHDVQLHVHPHWLSSAYNGGLIHPSETYSLHDFRNEPYPNNISGIIERGVHYLDALCKPINDGYRCIAFRGGGYDIGRSTDRILSALWENGIRIDSSIARGFRFESNISSIDFSNMPKRANWYVPLGGPLNSPSEHGIFEVPIISAMRNPLNNIPFLIKRIVSRQSSHEKGSGLHDFHTSRLKKIKRLLPFSSWMLSFDGLCFNASRQVSFLRKYLSQFPEETIFASTISHPKSMKDDNFKIMCDFIELLAEKYGDKLEFTTFQKVLDVLDGKNNLPVQK